MKMLNGDNKPEWACTKCSRGWYFEDTFDWDCTGKCSILFHPNCDSCGYSEDGLSCHECGDGWMLTPDRMSCQERFPNCKIHLKDQPQGLKDVEEGSLFICEEC